MAGQIEVGEDHKLFAAPPPTETIRVLLAAWATKVMEADENATWMLTHLAVHRPHFYADVARRLTNVFLLNPANDVLVATAGYAAQCAARKAPRKHWPRSTHHARELERHAGRGEPLHLRQH